MDPGIPEGTATIFTWLADKVLGGAKKALGWGWERGQWAAAQDRYDEQIIKQYGWTASSARRPRSRCGRSSLTSTCWINRQPAPV